MKAPDPVEQVVSLLKAQADGLGKQEWRLSDEERTRLARLGHMSANDWAEFAKSARLHLMLAYRDRDITFRRLMELARNVSLGCHPQVRLTFLGDTAERALRLKRLREHPTEPYRFTALMHMAVDLALDREALERERQSGRRFWDPVGTESIIHDSVVVIELIQLFPKAPSPARLHRWYLDRQRERGEGRKRGRPPKR